MPANQRCLIGEQAVVAVVGREKATNVLCGYGSPFAGFPRLFDRDALGQIPWLIHVAPTRDRDVVGQKLQW